MAACFTPQNGIAASVDCDSEGSSKRRTFLAPHFVDHAVDCPGCGETSEDLVAKPYRLDKQIAKHKWETVWEKMV